MCLCWMIFFFKSSRESFIALVNNCRWHVWTYHKAPFANREKWFGTVTVNSARSVNMNLSCNVSPTPASLSLCWYRAPVDLDTAFHFSNSYVILWYSLRKYNTTQNLPGVTPPAAVPAFSTETGGKGNLLKCGNYAYANSFTTLKQEENRKPSPQMLTAQVSLLLFVNNKYK